MCIAEDGSYWMEHMDKLQAYWMFTLLFLLYVYLLLFSCQTFLLPLNYVDFVVF